MATLLLNALSVAYVPSGKTRDRMDGGGGVKGEEVFNVKASAAAREEGSY